MSKAARWLNDQGQPLSCKEKVATLEDNLDELRDIAQDALEDALVMGVDREVAIQIFLSEIAALTPRFTVKPAKSPENDDAGAVVPSSRTES